jgi:hypothetical protein
MKTWGLILKNETVFCLFSSYAASVRPVRRKTASGITAPVRALRGNSPSVKYLKFHASCFKTSASLRHR